jgi:paraquat-inducible protein A
MALGGRSFLLGAALAAAGICLALGLTLPILKLTKFYFFSTEHSLVSTVNALLRSEQMFLGFMVLVFAIFLPVLKLLYLLLLAVLPQHEFTRLVGQLRALEWLGKWSMHDVLVLAIAIFFIKSQGISDARSVPGMYFFFAAVALMMLSYLWLKSDLSSTRPPVAGGQASASALRNLAFSAVLILAILSLGLGVFLPAVRFTTVYVWSREHSIASMIWALYSREQFLLCFVVFLVSVLFPFLKLLYLLTLVMTPQIPRALWSRSFAVMEWLGRYSMTDIMLLALMIFYINASGFAEATILPGVYLFAASALLTMLAFGWAHSVGASTSSPQPGSLAERLAQVSPGGTGTNLGPS